MALFPSALRVPHVSNASVTGASCPPRSSGNESKVYVNNWSAEANCLLPATRCSLVLFKVIVVNLTGKVHNVQPIKNPWNTGVSFFGYSPHLADSSAGIGTLPATLQGGCRAS